LQNKQRAKSKRGAKAQKKEKSAYTVDSKNHRRNTRACIISKKKRGEKRGPKRSVLKKRRFEIRSWDAEKGG